MRGDYGSSGGVVKARHRHVSEVAVRVKPGVRFHVEAIATDYDSPRHRGIEDFG